MASLSETVPARLGNWARSLFGLSLLFFSSRFLIHERRSLSLDGCFALSLVTDVEYDGPSLLVLTEGVRVGAGTGAGAGAGAGFVDVVVLGASATGFLVIDWLRRGSGSSVVVVVVIEVVSIFVSSARVGDRLTIRIVDRRLCSAVQGDDSWKDEGEATSIFVAESSFVVVEVWPSLYTGAVNINSNGSDLRLGFPPRTG